MAKHPGGRPQKEIDWKLVDRLCSYQCFQSEIAEELNVDLKTLDAACQRFNAMSFSEYYDKKKGAGKTKLRKIQFALAEQGSTAMAIFLGKHLLGQSDQPTDQVIMSAVQKAGMTKDQVLELIANAQAVGKSSNAKTFQEFCVAADYPEPFPKQVEMKNFGMNEIDPRLLLGSRGYGKTDYVVILGIAYDIYINPMASTNLIITKSKERNASMIKEIQTACEKNGVTFEKANSSQLRTTGLIGKDASVSAVTIRTVTLRGRHPKRVIMDDPVTEDDTSEATRLLVEKKWNEVNKLTSNVLIIGQPAHKYDLYAKLRPLLKKMEVPWGTIPGLDHDLTAQKLAGVDEKSISASYHLKILTEGTTPFDNVKYLDTFPTGDSAVAWIDPAYEGVDYTAISIIKGHMQGVAVVGFTYQRAWNHCLDDMVAQLKKYNVKRLAFETNSLGDQPIIMLRQLLSNTGIGVVGIKSTLNKHAKIMAAGSYAHLIHLCRESDKIYLKQVVEYEYKSKNDDAPDSLASCLEWIGLIRGKS